MIYCLSRRSVIAGGHDRIVQQTLPVAPRLSGNATFRTRIRNLTRRNARGPNPPVVVLHHGRQLPGRRRCGLLAAPSPWWLAVMAVERRGEGIRRRVADPRGDLGEGCAVGTQQV